MRCPKLHVVVRGEAFYQCLNFHMEKANKTNKKFPWGVLFSRSSDFDPRGRMRSSMMKLEPGWHAGGNWHNLSEG